MGPLIYKYNIVVAMKRDVTLEEYIARRNKGSKWSVIRAVYEEVSRGSIKLIDPNPPKTIAEYIVRLEYSLWFWSIVAFTIATIIIVYTSSSLPFIMPLRYVFGTIYVLFLPGYVLVEALYPEERELKPLERLALSIGLSLAVVPLIGLILNYTPWGIRLDPIIISLATYTLGLTLVATMRKFRVLRRKHESSFLYPR